MCRRLRGLLPLLIGISVILGGCMVLTQSGQNVQENVHVPSEDERVVVQGSNEFAFALFHTMRRDSPDRNLFFSPVSLSSAMAIACEGARGKTAEEIISVFRIPVNATVRQQGFSDLAATMNRETHGTVLRSANALWAEKTWKFRDDYMAAARRVHGAEARNLDFLHDPENSRQIINRWVMDESGDRIPELIPKGEITPDTALVITNAVYFQGLWKIPFDPSKTRDMDFHVAPNTTVRVPMMFRSTGEGLTRTTYTDRIQVLALPYQQGAGRNLSMYIIMPREGRNLADIEDQLDPRTFSEMRSRMREHDTAVYLPRLRILTEYRMRAPLSAMGMSLAFSPAADFSGMDGTGSLHISEIFHKAFVEVNEEGTEAAAATAAKMVWVSAPHPFTVDRPFICMIVDDDSGNILFFGQIVNPDG